MTDVIVGFRVPYTMGPDTEPLQTKIPQSGMFFRGIIAVKHLDRSPIQLRESRWTRCHARRRLSHHIGPLSGRDVSCPPPARQSDGCHQESLGALALSLVSRANHAPPVPQIPVTNAPEWLRTRRAIHSATVTKQRQQSPPARGIQDPFAVTLVGRPLPSWVMAQCSRVDQVQERPS